MLKKGSGIHLINKEIGETPLEAISRFKNENIEFQNEIMTYAGRLDPMAEGLLLLLSGEEVKKKENYLKLEKTYIFEMLWGFETDSQDLLGIPSREQASLPEVEKVKEELEKFDKTYVQKYPIYSSKTVQGKQLWVWAREGKSKE